MRILFNDKGLESTLPQMSARPIVAMITTHMALQSHPKATDYEAFVRVLSEALDWVARPENWLVR